VTKVLKIGGSIITDKTKSSAPHTDEIQRIANEIVPFAEDMVLIHGAGSFGHIPAKNHGLPEKFSPEGLRATHKSVVELNSLVVEALARAGAAPMPVHPFSCTLLKSGRIDCFALEPLREMISRGLLPVLHGDVAMDAARGAGIISGDQLVTYLARALYADLAAVGTDVDGVLFAGKPLAEITRDSLPLIESGLGGSGGVDVTGGMKGKLREMLDLADEGISSVIFNAAKKGNIAKVLSSEPAGTVVRRSA
jgi:isopentenyl phosphate kinase